MKRIPVALDGSPRAQIAAAARLAGSKNGRRYAAGGTTSASST